MSQSRALVRNNKVFFHWFLTSTSDVTQRERFEIRQRRLKQIVTEQIVSLLSEAWRWLEQWQSTYLLLPPSRYQRVYQQRWMAMLWEPSSIWSGQYRVNASTSAMPPAFLPDHWGSEAGALWRWNIRKSAICELALMRTLESPIKRNLTWEADVESALRAASAERISQLARCCSESDHGRSISTSCSEIFWNIYLP